MTGPGRGIRPAQGDRRAGTLRRRLRIASRPASRLRPGRSASTRRRTSTDAVGRPTAVSGRLRVPSHRTRLRFPAGSRRRRCGGLHSLSRVVLLRSLCASPAKPRRRGSVTAPSTTIRRRPPVTCTCVTRSSASAIASSSSATIVPSPSRLRAILTSSGGVPIDVHGCVGAAGRVGGSGGRWREPPRAPCRRCESAQASPTRGIGRTARGRGRAEARGGRGQCGGGARAERSGAAFSSGAVRRGTSCTSCRCRRGTDRSFQPWAVEGSSRSPPETAYGTRTPSCPGSCSRRSRPDR